MNHVDRINNTKPPPSITIFEFPPASKAREQFGQLVTGCKGYFVTDAAVQVVGSSDVITHVINFQDYLPRGPRAKKVCHLILNGLSPYFERALSMLSHISV